MSVPLRYSTTAKEKLGSFWLGGHFSRDYGIIMTAPPPEVFAERDVEKISVAGRSGDLLKDNGRYKNVPFSYKCAIIPNASESYRDAARRAVTILQPTPGYLRLENSFDAEHFRMARITGNISIESLVEQAGAFEIPFDCKPQRYLYSGENPLTYSEPGSILNEHFPALPLIKVTGSGDGTVTIGDTLVKIFGQTDPIFLDCDLQNAYHETAEGIKENMNSYIYAPKFPVLEPGLNTVAWTGGVTALEITPRWWTL